MGDNLLLNYLHLRVKEPLSLENIPKDYLVAYFDVILKGLETLLETINERSIEYLRLLPPVI